MPTQTSPLHLQMREACKSTGACWAVCLERDETGWRYGERCKLSKILQRKLSEFIETRGISSWLSGALVGRRARSRSIADIGLSCKRVYVFPQRNAQSLFLVAAQNEMDAAQRHVWHALSVNGAKPTAYPQSDKTPDWAASALVERLALVAIFSQMVGTTEGWDEIVHQTFALLETGFKVCGAAICVLEGGKKKNVRVYTNREQGADVYTESLSDSPLKAVLRGGGESYLEHPTKKIPFIDKSAQCCLVLPFKRSERVLGALYLESERPHAFSLYDRHLLSLVASQLSGLLESARLQAETESGTRNLEETVLELQETQQELQARISAQKEAEARLIQAAKLAAVGEMAAGVAHELNNPLTTVVGFTELALEDLPPELPARDDLELVLKEARRARSVVRRLLDFARQGETSRIRADLNEIVDDVMVLTKHLLHTSRVQPEIRLKKSLPWVLVDRNQIKQVVINLVNNALYAMPDGGRLVVETDVQSRYRRRWLSLSVRDTGVGIPPENLSRIFEPFFTTRGGRGGTGLGLSVTYGIVTDHGGMIEVESEVDAGATFIVWLPLEEQE